MTERTAEAPRRLVARYELDASAGLGAGGARGPG